MSEIWDDLYAPGGKRTGERCPEKHPTLAACQCVRQAGHDGDHRNTSSADGRSVSWPNDSATEYRTPGGRVLGDADIEALADEAERGYDVEKIKSRPRCANCGRPLELILYTPGDRCENCLDEEVETDKALAERRELDLLDSRLRERP